MKLYYAPGACSIGIHFLLEEIGKPYETVRLNIREGDQFKPNYIAINPKSKVPVLQRDDGSVLTEFPVVSLWLAKTNPDSQLLPAGLEGEVRTLETLDYCVSTIHMQALSRILRPAKYAPSASDHEAVQSNGLELAGKAFGNLAETLGDRAFIMGDRLTIADSALFYTLFWAIDRIKMEVPEKLAAYYARLRARPAAKKVFAIEGISIA